jgi:hypothetical protein
MQGIILFCALGAELLIRYRIRVTRRTRITSEGDTAPEAV